MIISKKNEIRFKNILKLLNVLFLVLVCSIYFISLRFEINITQFLKYYSLFTYVFIIVTSKLFYKWNHSYILFLLSFGLFLLTRVFLDIFGIVDIGFADKWIYYTISNETINKVLLLFIISLYSVNFGTLQKFSNRIDFFKNNVPFRYPKSLNLIIVVIIITLIPGTFLKLLHDLQQSYQLGYDSVYTVDRVPAHFLFRASWFLLKAVIPLYLLINPNKKQFFFFVFLVLFIDFSSIFSGSRSALIAPVGFLFWYYFKFYSFKPVRLKTLLIISIIVIIFSTVSLSLREKLKMSKFNLPHYTFMFLNGQGVTYMTCVYYFDFKDKLLNPSRFVLFNSINNYLLRSKVEISHNVEYVKETLSLDHKLTYAVTPKLYLEGKGLGTSFLIELFALGGWIAVLIGSYFLGVLIIYFDNLFSTNINSLFFSWYWIVHLFWMARAELLPDLVSLLLTFFILYFLKYLILIYKQISNPIHN